MQKLLKNMNKEAKHLLAVRTISWGLPVVMIPALRFLQDKDRDPKLRKELFVRDFSSYSVGAGIYFGTLAASLKAIKSSVGKNLSPAKKILIPELVATGLYGIWCGLVAPKLSKKINYSGAKPEDTSRKFSTFELYNSPIKNNNINFAKNYKYSNSAIYPKNVFSGFKI